MMTKQDKLARIYEVIAPRGVEEINETGVGFVGERTLSIGPVYIGDVIKWLHQKSEERDMVDGKRQWKDAKERREQVIILCVSRLRDLSAPIDDNDDAIDFIYSLL